MDPKVGFILRRGILGVGKQTITIPTTKNEINIMPEPVGSLVKMVYNDIHRFESSGISQLGMAIDLIPGSVSFQENGNTILSSKKPIYSINISSSANIYKYIDIIKTTSTTSNKRVSYFFAFPSTEGPVNFRAYYTGKLKSPIAVNLERGGEYELLFDLTSASIIDDVTPTLKKTN